MMRMSLLGAAGTVTGSKYRPALPLYTREDAAACLDQLRPVAYDDGSNWSLE